MKRDKLLEQAIQEAEAFLKECKAYQKRINTSYKSYSGYIHFNTASTERGILKHRALLLTRKLQAWRKGGKAE